MLDAFWRGFLCGGHCNAEHEMHQTNSQVCFDFQVCFVLFTDPAVSTLAAVIREDLGLDDSGNGSGRFGISITCKVVMVIAEVIVE